MSDTWITQLRHFLNEQGEFPEELPAPARKLAMFFAKIVETTTAGERGVVRCRRRPNRSPCPGRIEAALDGVAEIRWNCPVCGDCGVLSGFAGTQWDKSTLPPGKSQEGSFILALQAAPASLLSQTSSGASVGDRAGS